MARLEFEPFNIVLSVFFALTCGILFFVLKKRGLLSLDLALQRENGFDPMAMSVGIPTWMNECTAPFAHSTQSPSLIERIKQTNLHNNNDDMHELKEIMSQIRVYQWRLGMYRLCCLLYTWPVWIASMVDVGTPLFGFFTIWNYISLCVYFTLTTHLTLMDYFHYFRDSMSKNNDNDNDGHNYALQKAHYSSCEWICVLCSFRIFGTLTNQCSHSVLSSKTTNISFIRKLTWLFLGCELALVMHIFFIVFVVFYPLGDKEDRQRLTNQWSVHQHGLNVFILFVDYLFNSASVLYTQSDLELLNGNANDNTDDDNGESESDGSLSICDLCSTCVMRIQPLCIMIISFIFLWFSYANHALGSKFVYPNLDPSVPVNAPANLVNLLLMLFFWFIVLVIDVKCLRKYHTQTRVMDQFFDKYNRLVKEVQL